MPPHASPLQTPVLFRVGPVPVAEPVVTSAALVVVLGLLSWSASRRFTLRPSRVQAVLEAAVLALEDQIGEIMRRDPKPFTPLLGTLFLFILAANLSSVVPGVQAATASLETPAALAIVVFASTHYYGIRVRGLRRYLGSYLEPNPLMLPLNVLSELTRTFSLMMRLFGNIMSHELVIGIVVTIAALIMPVPFLALGILVGVVQAYIFWVLATVFIGAAVGASEEGQPT